MWETAGEPLMKEPDLRRGLTPFYFRAIDVYLSGEAGHRGCMAVSAAGVEAVNDPDIRDALRRIIEGLDHLLGDRIRRAVEEGQIPVHDASVRGLFAAAVLHSLSVRAHAVRRSGTRPADPVVASGPRKQLY